MVVGGGWCVVAEGMHGCRGACVVVGGVHGCGGCVVVGGMRGIRRDTVNEQAVYILLECILVTEIFSLNPEKPLMTIFANLSSL